MITVENKLTVTEPKTMRFGDIPEGETFFGIVENSSGDRKCFIKSRISMESETVFHINMDTRYGNPLGNRYVNRVADDDLIYEYEPVDVKLVITKPKKTRTAKSFPIFSEY
jgi:hypothetical protein